MSGVTETGCEARAWMLWASTLIGDGLARVVADEDPDHLESKPSGKDSTPHPPIPAARSWIARRAGCLVTYGHGGRAGHRLHSRSVKTRERHDLSECPAALRPVHPVRLHRPHLRIGLVALPEAVPRLCLVRAVVRARRVHGRHGARRVDREPRERSASANLLAAYGWIEAAIGVAALVFHEVFVWLTPASRSITSIPALGSPATPSRSTSTRCAALLIVPQTVLLGMTFPLMSGAVIRRSPEASGHHLAMLYFTNSIGAAAGALAAAFLLLGWLGMPGTMRAAGVLNLVLAAVVLAHRAARRAAAVRRGARRRRDARRHELPGAAVPRRGVRDRARPRSSTRSRGSGCSRSCSARRSRPSS